VICLRAWFWIPSRAFVCLVAEPLSISVWVQTVHRNVVIRKVLQKFSSIPTIACSGRLGNSPIIACSGRLGNSHIIACSGPPSATHVACLPILHKLPIIHLLRGFHIQQRHGRQRLHKILRSRSSPTPPQSIIWSTRAQKATLSVRA